MDHINRVQPDFSGCILITKAEKTVYAGAFGYADLPNKIPNTMTTRFATASAGKVFVAAGILKLIEAGKLKFDSSIANLLNFDLRAIDPAITVEQLLTNTSGIPDYFNEQVMDDYSELWRDYPNYKIRTSSDLIPLFINKPMMYPRGERFQYNNTGYVVLGLMIEAVTGMPFDQYLQEAVFLPCGMNDTGYYALDRLPERCAQAYIHDETSGEYHTNIYSVDVKGTGAGGAFTTVWDIHRFWDGLMNGTILSGTMVRNMLSWHAGDKDTGYGYGIWLERQQDGTFVPYFEGSDPGVSFLSKRSVDGTVRTAVSNMGHPVWSVFKQTAG